MFQANYHAQQASIKKQTLHHTTGDTSRKQSSSAAQETSAEASLAVLQAQAACMKTVTGTLAAYCLSSLPC
jgi:hypothetical protein